jgi:hypothetical protein
MTMNEDDLNRHLLGSTLWIALAAILIALPNLIGGAYDLLYPRAALVNDKPLPSLETYTTELYERLSERESRALIMFDEEKIRTLYTAAERDHLTVVSHQARRRLLMYGALMAVGVFLLFTKFRFKRA